MENSIQSTSSYLHIPGLVHGEHLQLLEQLVNNSAYKDGKSTATMAAREVKNNLQIDVNDQTTLPVIHQVITQALYSSPLFQTAVMPKHIYPPLVSRYEPGMSYGWHVDSPIMGGNGMVMRADIAMTIFLSDPDTYEGGELVVLSPVGEMTYKLAKGDAIIYPCTQVHGVNEVTSGVRKVAVTWIESLVPDAEKRKVLFDLRQVYDAISIYNPKSAEANLLLQTHSNLLRMWS